MFDQMKDWVYQQHCQFGNPIGSTINTQWVEIAQNPAADMYISIRCTQFLDDHRMIISAGKEHIAFVRDFIGLHESNPFSSETFDDLHRYLTDQNENLKAELQRGRKQHGFLYAITEQKDLDLSRMQASTTEFHKNTKDEIIAKYVHISQDIRSVHFGTCIDGKIVSVAACNEAHDPDIHTEEIEVLTIGVGTHEDYQGRGYATSNVVALADHHLRKGRQVAYITGVANQVSQHVATSAGFTKLAQEMMIVCFRG